VHDGENVMTGQKEDMRGAQSAEKEAQTAPYDAGLCTLQAPCPSGTSFLFVAMATLVLFMGATIPTPLYGLYQEVFSLSSVSITLIYAAYAIAVVPSLFIFGPLGDQIGRRRILLIAVIVTIGGTILLGTARSPAWLIAGRVGQGIGVGAASGNATAALVELEPGGNTKRAAQAAGMALFGGLGLGPLFAGFMAEYLPEPTVLVYALEFALLIVALILLSRVGEGGQPRKRDRIRMHRPTLPPAKGAFAAASLASALVFAMAGLYFSLAPSYVREILHTSSIALGGAIAAIMVFSSLVTELVLWNRPSVRMVIGGLFALMAGLSLIVFARYASSIEVLVGATVVSGAGFGATFQGAVSIINRIAPSEHRGDTTSSFYAVSYLALGVPIIILGLLTQSYNLLAAVQDFVLAVIVIAVADIIWIYLLGR
jgi:MFS family permease